MDPSRLPAELIEERLLLRRVIVSLMPSVLPRRGFLAGACAPARSIGFSFHLSRAARAPPEGRGDRMIV